MSRFFYPERVQRISVALLLALVLAFIGRYVCDTERESGIRRGDFPAFWSMAVIADGATPERLYDAALQTRVQNESWPSLNGETLPGAYPAYVAFLLRPMARLDVVVARNLWTLVSVLLASCAVCIMVARNRDIARFRLPALAAVAIFVPSIMGIVGGQLLALGMLLYAGCFALERRRDARGELLFGCLIGVWLLKPYYALAMVLLPLLRRQWWSIVGFLAVGGVLWYLGFLVLGLGWVGEWFAFARWFGERNLAENGHQMPNIVALTQWVAGSVGYDAPGSLLQSLVFVGALALLGCEVIREERGLSGVPARVASSPSGAMVLFAPLVVFSVSQANFYDLGLVACSVLMVFCPRRRADWMWAAGFVLLGGVGIAARGHGSFPWFALLACAMLVYLVTSVKRLRNSRPQ